MSAIPVPCANCEATIPFDPDDMEDAPHVKVQAIGVEDGERVSRRKEKRYLCDDCRDDVVDEMLGLLD